MGNPTSKINATLARANHKLEEFRDNYGGSDPQHEYSDKTYLAGFLASQGTLAMLVFHHESADGFMGALEIAVNDGSVKIREILETPERGILQKTYRDIERIASVASLAEDANFTNIDYDLTERPGFEFPKGERKSPSYGRGNASHAIKKKARIWDSKI